MSDGVKRSTTQSSEVKFTLAGIDQLALLGGNDTNLRLLEESFSGTITVRGEMMTIRGPAGEVALLADVVETLLDRVRTNQPIDAVTLSYLLDRRRADAGLAPNSDGGEGQPLFFSSASRQAIRARTPGQVDYVEAIRNNELVFALGPAGTGKTYLAMVMALDYLKRNLVDRLILVRPAVEAGEQLGYLPGDLQEKINPYLRPLYDALSDLVGPGKVAKFLANGVIEASPLAYMRGRTLNNAFVILDEAQNTTVGQMKMFLTRLGFQSRAVVTGDITQIDLRDSEKSGLVHVQEILSQTEGVGFVRLEGCDVQRHPLVRRIVDAFDDAGRREGGGK